MILLVQVFRPSRIARTISVLNRIGFSLFSIAISAAETAVAIAIMINIYRNIRSIQVNKLDEMKW